MFTSSFISFSVLTGILKAYVQVLSKNMNPRNFRVVTQFFLSTFSSNSQKGNIKSTKTPNKGHLRYENDEIHRTWNENITTVYLLN